jgi:hypothetical protein
MYSVVVQKLNLWFPFTPFEMSVLRILNIPPIQLHPNSWGYVKSFEIICDALGIDHRPGVFFYFYYIKGLKEKFVSLYAQPNRGLFNRYASNFKNFHDSFFHVCGGEKCRGVMFDDSGVGLFPFYWFDSPRLVKGVDEEPLTPFEFETIAFLSSFEMFETKDFLRLEPNPAGGSWPL